MAEYWKGTLTQNGEFFDKRLLCNLNEEIEEHLYFMRMIIETCAGQ